MQIQSLIRNQRPLSQTHSIDYDDLYEYMLKYIKEVQSESRKINMLFPTIDSNKLKELSLKLDDFLKIDSYISSQFKVLDKELSIIGLEQKLKPVREAIQKLKSIVLTSQNMVDLSQKITMNIDKTNTLTKSLNQQLSTSQLQPYEASLEQLMDDCERINEKLDSLGDKPFVVNLIKPRYEQLVMLVMLLQDKFESYE